MTVSLTNPDTGAVTVAPASYTFTTSNWNMARSFTVSGVEENSDYDDETVTISHSATSSDSDYSSKSHQLGHSVNVMTTTCGPPSRSRRRASATEGDSASLTITSSKNAPTGGVAFSVTTQYSTMGTGNAVAADVGTITTMVTVAENTSSKTISIPTAEDSLDEDAETFKVVIATSVSPWVKAGDGKDTATITINDDDTAGFTVTPTTLNID